MDVQQMPYESIYQHWLQKLEQLSAGFLRCKLIVDDHTSGHLKRFLSNHPWNNSESRSSCKEILRLKHGAHCDRLWPILPFSARCDRPPGSSRPFQPRSAIAATVPVPCGRISSGVHLISCISTSHKNRVGLIFIVKSGQAFIKHGAHCYWNSPPLPRPELLGCHYTCCQMDTHPLRPARSSPLPICLLYAVKMLAWTTEYRYLDGLGPCDTDTIAPSAV
ncbi:hypothetical protein J6590_006250 [Homalodisca vitripennis]|nr:hypothetical protein J6590_006250 [Homalodisca vitripennis]